MCGICGSIHFKKRNKPVDGELLRNMTSALRHRGPDDSGMVFLSSNANCDPFIMNGVNGDREFQGMNGDYNIGLGHQRLSIIDLSPFGRQPMSNEDYTIWITYNGEIYNYKALRSELKARGHEFKSNSDTEVIIHLYEQEGIEGIDKLNGMFAFGLWDGNNERLFLARDRLGIKPLVYYVDNRRILFASEIKSILQDPSVPKEIDWAALDLYLTFNYIPAPWTIFKGIKKLEPGYYLVMERETLRIEKYWDVPHAHSEKNGKDETTDNDIAYYKKRLFSLIEESVKMRMISDVPLGAFLSGGIDSSIIVGLMAKNSSQPIKTFSIGYQDLELFDETKYAREVAQLNHTEHYEFKLTYKDILDVFPTVLSSFDEPFADSSAVPTFLVSKETRELVTVALAGDGSDELFAGYRMYLGEYFRRYYLFLPSFLRNRVIEPFFNALPDSRDSQVLEYVRRGKKFLEGVNKSLVERLFSWSEIFPQDERARLLETVVRTEKLCLNRGESLIEKGLLHFTEDDLNKMLYMDMKHSLPGDMLNKVDWMSMKNSLEVRVPFLDHRVVNTSFEMAGNLKLRGRRRKYILMETFRDILPKSLHNRPKWGFEMPIGRWLKGELKFLIDDYLSKERIYRQGIFNSMEIERLKQELFLKRSDTSWKLWNLIVFQHWHERHFPHN
ncbi:MAG: asparagine synthase (glutamine-hydrolyzing) [Thermodesulfobacteriota bacterium]|nr:asparagine synthase (glutamine-hydrolyzing) [Thermodesulfobacteriota bacterium]